MTYFQKEVIKTVLSIILVGVILGYVAFYYTNLPIMIILSIPIGFYLGNNLANKLDKHYD